MTKILALDTSSENCSIALHCADGSIEMMIESTPRSHTQLALPMIERILKKHEISLADVAGIAFGKGPGSFTGIRIAAGIAQGLAFGAGKPICAISNLEALALQCHDTTEAKYVLVAIDARMNEVYWGVYEILVSTNDEGKTERRVRPLCDEQVSAPESIDISLFEPAITDQNLVGIGSGFEFFECFPEVLRNRVEDYDATAQPLASTVCELALLDLQDGKTGDISQALPSYVRDTITWKKLPGRE